MGDAAVEVQQRGHVAVLTLPMRAWASVTVAATDALARTCEALGEDAAVRAVVVTGEGEHFCGDWSRTVPALRDQLDGRCCSAFQPLADLPQPVVAALNGPVHGAALELALAADIRLGTPATSALLCNGESVPLAGGLTRLSRAVGRARATWMALAAVPLAAEEALAAGLVAALLPAEDLLAEAERVATVIAARGPIAVRFAKEALREGPDLTLAQALRYETDLTVILQTTADRAEGVAAFVEKRAPLFEGR